MVGKYCPTCEKWHTCWVAEGPETFPCTYACLFCDATVTYCEHGIAYTDGQRWQPSPWWFLSFEWLKGLYAQVFTSPHVQ